MIVISTIWPIIEVGSHQICEVLLGHVNAQFCQRPGILALARLELCLCFWLDLPPSSLHSHQLHHSTFLSQPTLPFSSAGRSRLDCSSAPRWMEVCNRFKSCGFSADTHTTAIVAIFKKTICETKRHDLCVQEVGDGCSKLVNFCIAPVCLGPEQGINAVIQPCVIILLV